MTKDLSDDIKEAVMFDYNKANEWHYPSKGELPEESGEYLVIAESDHTLYTCLKNYDPDDKE